MSTFGESIFGDMNGTEVPKKKRRGAAMTAEEREAVRMRNLSIASALRAGGRTHGAIAKAFGVSRGTVSNVNLYVVQGKVKRYGKEGALTAGSPAMVAIEQAERELKKAQRAVLIAEAVLHEAHAQLARERAEAMAQ